MECFCERIPFILLPSDTFPSVVADHTWSGILVKRKAFKVCDQNTWKSIVADHAWSGISVKRMALKVCDQNSWKSITCGCVFDPLHIVDCQSVLKSTFEVFRCIFRVFCMHQLSFMSALKYRARMCILICVSMNFEIVTQLSFMSSANNKHLLYVYGLCVEERSENIGFAAAECVVSRR